MRRVALWVILGVLLLASGGTASARPLTPKEKAFARDLQRALGLTISKAVGSPRARECLVFGSAFPT